jgi:hypothetical protein
MAEKTLLEFCAYASSNFKNVHEFEDRDAFDSNGQVIRMYFENYPALVGDFSWFLQSYAITRAEIAEKLSKEFPEIEFERVLITTSKGTVPKRPTTFQNETYFRIKAKHEVELDWDKTTFVESEGQRKIIGLESWRGSIPYDFVRHPRKQGHGFYVRQDDVGSRAFFGIKDKNPSYYCTSRFKDFIVRHAFTNVDFMEVGGIV